MNIQGTILRGGDEWPHAPAFTEYPAPASVDTREDGKTEWASHFLEAGRLSVLICIGDEAAPDALANMVRAAGYRVLDVVPIAAATSHIPRLIALEAAVVRCSGAEPGLDALLSRLDSMADANAMGLLVVTDLAGLDIVHGLMHSRNGIILCEPEAADLAAALVALSLSAQPMELLHDIGREDEASRFDRLSDQLLRLNQMVEALVQDRTAEKGAESTSAFYSTVHSPGRGYTPSPSRLENGRPRIAIEAHQVRAVLKARRLRDQLLAPDLFADPAWDILLDLLAARLENNRVSVSSLCIAAAVPPTTALRWIRQLTDRGLLDRHADPRDGRRIFITLSDFGMDAVTRWFDESRAYLQAASRSGNEGADD